MSGKKIVLGITGSIAAYKSCYLLRELVRRGADVQVVITPAGKEFVTPVTLSALSGRPVVSEFFANSDGTWHSHVDIGRWADAMLIAPCTAATLGKMAGGVADNILVTTYLAMKAPVFVAPAMDLDMCAHPSTQRNLEILRGYGVEVVEPQSGFLASGLVGKGRMEEPMVIADRLETYFGQGMKDLKGRKVLVTAGPTYEKIDPVRFIGNYSTGKMGYCIASECAMRGAHVVLVSGPTALSCPSGVERILVESGREMSLAAETEFADADIAVLSAAVADYRPAEQSAVKMKRGRRPFSLELMPTDDIAAKLGAAKRGSQLLVGFALETDNEEMNAEAKLESKNLDMIVLNSLRNEGTCFRSDYNKVEIISRSAKAVFEKKPKEEVAADIVDAIVAAYGA